MEHHLYGITVKLLLQVLDMLNSCSKQFNNVNLVMFALDTMMSQRLVLYHVSHKMVYSKSSLQNDQILFRL